MTTLRGTSRPPVSGFATRKLAASSKPKTTISEDGDLYTVTTVSAVGTTVRTLTDSFTLGQAFDKQLDDGRTVKATVTREGNRLVERSRPSTPSTAPSPPPSAARSPTTVSKRRAEPPASSPSAPTCESEHGSRSAASSRFPDLVPTGESCHPLLCRNQGLSRGSKQERSEIWQGFRAYRQVPAARLADAGRTLQLLRHRGW